MNETIQLLHPEGKKAVKIDVNKFTVIKEAILKSLKNKKQLTHKELLHAVAEVLDKSKTKFEGSVGWYMEWVKLDLEANNIIERISGQSPHTWTLRVNS